MCVLCGDSITHLHWTEESRYASDTGGMPSEGSGYTEGGRGDPQGELRRERMRRAHAAGELLDVYGLKLSQTFGRDYQLSDNKGRAALVGNLGALWSEAERLSGRPVDPLDPNLVESLKTRSRQGT